MDKGPQWRDEQDDMLNAPLPHYLEGSGAKRTRANYLEEAGYLPDRTYVSSSKRYFAVHEHENGKHHARWDGGPFLTVHSNKNPNRILETLPATSNLDDEGFPNYGAHWEHQNTFNDWVSKNVHPKTGAIRIHIPKKGNTDG